MLSRVDVLQVHTPDCMHRHCVLDCVDQEQMQAIDSQAFRFASEDQCEELNRLAIQLETRIARLMILGTIHVLCIVL